MLRATLIEARNTLVEVAVRSWAPFGTRRLQEAAANTDPVRLVLGSGMVTLPGWLNTDIHWRTGLYLDAGKPWPLEPGSVSLIYSDNMIEHLPFRVAVASFRHAFEALKPGGVMRVVTPDVEASARQYLDNGNLATAGLARHREKGKPGKHSVELIRSIFADDGHWQGYCWDYASLSAELEEVGFVVMRQEVNVSGRTDLQGLETRIDPTEAATSLVVEAEKPDG